MKINLIVARTVEGVIGINHKIPWHSPEDFKHFRKLTQGHAVVMGRNTFLEIGRPLPNRLNFVITSKARELLDQFPNHPNLHFVDNLEVVTTECKRQGCSELWVIGGIALYNQMATECDNIHITEIDVELEVKVTDVVSVFDFDPLLNGFGLMTELPHDNLHFKHYFKLPQ